MKNSPRGIPSRRAPLYILDNLKPAKILSAVSLNRRLLSSYSGPLFSLYFWDASVYGTYTAWPESNGILNYQKLIKDLSQFANYRIIQVYNQASYASMHWVRGWTMPELALSFYNHPKMVSCYHAGNANQALFEDTTSSAKIGSISLSPTNAMLYYTCAYPFYRPTTSGDNWQRSWGCYDGSGADYYEGSWTAGPGENGRAAYAGVDTMNANAGNPNIIKVGTNPTGGERLYGYWPEAVIWCDKENTANYNENERLAYIRNASTFYNI